MTQPQSQIESLLCQTSLIAIMYDAVELQFGPIICILWDPSIQDEADAQMILGQTPSLSHASKEKCWKFLCVGVPMAHCKCVRATHPVERCDYVTWPNTPLDFDAYVWAILTQKISNVTWWLC